MLLVLHLYWFRVVTLLLRWRQLVDKYTYYLLPGYHYVQRLLTEYNKLQLHEQNLFNYTKILPQKNEHR
jgi:hypothetical protein